MTKHQKQNEPTGTLEIAKDVGVRIGNYPSRQFTGCACNGEHLVGVSLCVDAVAAWAYVPSGEYDEKTLKAFGEALADLFGVRRYAVSFEQSQNPETQPPVAMQ